MGVARELLYCLAVSGLGGGEIAGLVGAKALLDGSIGGLAGILHGLGWMDFD